ncbi:MAG: ECF transporter S component [Lachnospiraceae bacterium]|nr:ECF transporter S component [Lachnospiraceae bacterium]
MAKKSAKEQIKKLALAGIIAALCYVGYAVFPAISVTGTKVHLGNAFVILGALLLGPLYGGLAGAVGLSLADILGGYAQSSPRTFICKLLIGVIVGLIAHKIGKINKKQPWNKIVLWTVVGTVTAMIFNCVFEPTLKYVWYTLLTPDADKAASAIKSLMAITTTATIINAVINSITGIAFYLALRPILIKSGIIVLDEVRDTDKDVEEGKNSKASKSD